MGRRDGRLRFGTTVPVASQGIDGDSYVLINTSGGTATFYLKAAGAWTKQFIVDLAQQAGAHTRRGAISADATLDAAEVLAGTSTTLSVITMPMWGSGCKGSGLLACLRMKSISATFTKAGLVCSLAGPGTTMPRATPSLSKGISGGRTGKLWTVSSTAVRC